MVDTVNDSTLWGLSSRKVKLSNVSWTRNTYGLCYVYYTRNFEFDIDFTTFDRVTPDHGLMVLNGKWADDVWQLIPPSDSTDPRNFIRYKDKHANFAKVFLDGSGKPVGDVADSPDIDIEYYDESNFLTLGIPTTL